MDPVDRFLKEEARRALRRVPLEARRRSTKACEACRWRKTKCSGTLPCDKCLKHRRGNCCYYSATSSNIEAHKFGNISTSCPLPLAMNQVSEADESHPRGGSTQFRAASTDLPVRHKQRDRIALCNLNIGNAPNPPAEHTHDVLLLNATQTVTSIGDLCNSSVSEMVSGDLNSIPSLLFVSQLLPDKLGEFRYVGEAGFLSFLEQVRRYVGTTQQQREDAHLGHISMASFHAADFNSSFPAIAPSSASFCTSDRNFLSISRQKVIEDDVGQGMLEGRSFDSCLAYLGREELMKLLSFAESGNLLVALFFSFHECESWIDNMTNNGVYKNNSEDAQDRRRELGRTIVLQLILALGLLYAPASQGGRQADARAVSLIESSFRLLREGMLAEGGAILSVQAFALATVICLTLCKRHAAWIYLGTAIRCAQALGLHSKAVNARFPSRERSARLRHWWGLYILDRMLSTTHGRPFAIDEQCYDEEFDENEICHHLLTWEGPWLVLMVKTVHVHEKIQRRVYQHQDGNRSQHGIEQILLHAQALASDLHLLQAQIPEMFSLSSLHTTQHSDLRAALLMFHLEFFCSYQHLSRLFLLVAFENIPDPMVKRYGAPHLALYRDIKSFADKAVDCADHIIAIVWRLFLKKALPRRCPSLSHNIFTAGLILSAHVFHSMATMHSCLPPSAIDHSQNIDRGIELLHHISRDVGDITAERYYNVLDAFRQDVNKLRHHGQFHGLHHESTAGGSNSHYPINRDSSQDVEDSCNKMNSGPNFILHGDNIGIEVGPDVASSQTSNITGLVTEAATDLADCISEELPSDYWDCLHAGDFPFID